MMNRLKNVIKKNPESEKKNRKKKKYSDLDEIYELLEEVDRHITNRNKNIVTVNMQTDEVAGLVSSDTESELCGHCVMHVCWNFLWFLWKMVSLRRGMFRSEKCWKQNFRKLTHPLCMRWLQHITKKSKNEMQKTNCNINNQKLN